MSTSAPIDQQERETLEMIAGSFPDGGFRDDCEEAIWRAFIDMLAQNHDMSDLFTIDEVLNSYHVFLRMLITAALRRKA